MSKLINVVYNDGVKEIVYDNIANKINTIYSSGFIFKNQANPIQDMFVGWEVGGGWTGAREELKDFPTSFSPATSTNVRISPKNLLPFRFNPFATLI